MRRAKILVLVTLAIVAAGSAMEASPGNPSKDALVQFFTAKNSSPEIDPTRHSVEICYGSTCSLYHLDGDFARPEAWDVVFLHEYYYIGTNTWLGEFKVRNADLADSLMARYGRLCPRVEDNAKHGCVVGYLGLRNKVRYAFVWHREGNRCEVWTHLVHSKTMYGSSCRKIEP